MKMFFILLMIDIIILVTSGMLLNEGEMTYGYIGLGVGALLLVGIIIYYIKRKNKTCSDILPDCDCDFIPFKKLDCDFLDGDCGGPDCG